MARRERRAMTLRDLTIEMIGTFVLVLTGTPALARYGTATPAAVMVVGASVNPARSIGPALVTVDFTDLWMYALAPFAGSAISAAAFRRVALE